MNDISIEVAMDYCHKQGLYPRLDEYEQTIRADERVKVIEEFVIKLENAIQEDIDDNVISQWDKGTFMGCVKFVAEQLKEQK